MLRRYKKLEIRDKVDSIKQQLKLDSCYGSMKRLRYALESNDYILLFYPFHRESFSGASFLANSLKVIVINSSQSLGRQHYTLAHELGHIVLGHGDTSDEINIDISKSKEKEADRFAAEFLLPEICIRPYLIKFQRHFFNAVMLIYKISQNFEVSFEFAYYRVREYTDFKNAEELSIKNTKVTKLAELLNGNLDIYRPTGEKYLSRELYLNLALEALEKEKISIGRFFELLNALKKFDEHFDPDEFYNQVRVK